MSIIQNTSHCDSSCQLLLSPFFVVLCSSFYISAVYLQFISIAVSDVWLRCARPSGWERGVSSPFSGNHWYGLALLGQKTEYGLKTFNKIQFKLNNFLRHMVQNNVYIFVASTQSFGLLVCWILINFHMFVPQNLTTCNSSDFPSLCGSCSSFALMLSVNILFVIIIGWWMN